MAGTPWLSDEHIEFIRQKAHEILSGNTDLALVNVRGGPVRDDRIRKYEVIIENVKTGRVVTARVDFVDFSNLFDPGDLARAERLVQQAIDSALAASARSHDEAAV